MVEFCAERGLCVDNTCYKHRSFHKYTRIAKGQDKVEVKSIIDLVLVKKYTLCFVQDVRAVRGMGRSFSHHHVVLCYVRLVGA